MIEETVTKPKVCLVTPAERSHKPKGMPSAKLGIAADMPKNMKLNCVFLSFSIIYFFPIEIRAWIIFATCSNFAMCNNFFDWVFTL